MYFNLLLLTAYTFTVNLPKWRFSKLLPWLFRSIAGTLCTPPRCSFNVDCSCFFFPLSDSPRALHSLRSSTTVKSLNGLIPPFLFDVPAGPALCVHDQPVTVMDNESCMSDHDTFLHLHYKHYNQHFLPFVLHFQTVVQAHLHGRISQHHLLSPLCLFLHVGEGDQGILILCPHMLAAQFL